MPQAVPLILAATAVAGTGYSVYQGERAASKAEDAAKDATRRANEQKASLLKKQEEDKTAQELIRSRDAQLIRARVGGLRGIGSTRLTGPEGVTPVTAGGKTMLGA